MKARGRLGELDVLRGVAAAAVVVYHYTKFLRENLQIPPAAWLEMPLLSWLYPFKIGEYGVALFFVISGFVIFMTLDRTEKTMDFVVSRFSRLYPAFWCGVLLTTSFRVWLWKEPFHFDALLANFTMFPTWLGYTFADGVYWTLIVEMQFYALMLLLWRLRLLARIELLCLGWFALLVFTRVAPRLGITPAMVQFGADALILNHAPLFAAGMMFYRVYRQGPTVLRGVVIGLALIATFLSGNVHKSLVVTLSFAAMALLCADRLAPLARSRFWRWLGDRSYSLYLVHMTMGLILMEQIATVTRQPWVLLLVPTAVSLLLAELMRRLVERPALLAVRRWYEKDRPAGPPEVRTSTSRP